MRKTAIACLLLLGLIEAKEAKAQTLTRDANGTYIGTADNGQQYYHVNPTWLTQYIASRNVELSSQTRSHQPIPTGVITTNFPVERHNWYAGAPLPSGQNTTGDNGPRQQANISLTVFGPDAEATLQRLESNPNFQSVAQRFGDRLHPQYYSRDKAEEIAPGITGHDTSGVVIGVIQHGQPNDGKVLWRSKGDAQVEEIVGQLRDRADPSYDPDNDPGPNSLPKLPSADQVIRSPVTKLAALGLAFFVIRRKSTWTGL